MVVPEFPEIDLLIYVFSHHPCHGLVFWVYNCTIAHIYTYKISIFSFIYFFSSINSSWLVTWNKPMIWIIWQYLNNLGPFQCKPLLLSLDFIWPVHKLLVSLCFVMCCLSWIMQVTGCISVSLGCQTGNRPRKNQFNFGASSGISIGGDCWRYVLWIKFCLSLVPVLAWKWLNENQMVEV